MKFRLKTLFLVILLAAMLIGSVTLNVQTVGEARRLKELVDDSIVASSAATNMRITRHEFRSDFIIFSSGNAGWDVEIDDQSRVQVDLSWRARLWFTTEPSISLRHRDKASEQEFAKKLIAELESRKPGIVVSETEG